MRCGNSAETQSNIQPNACYSSAVFPLSFNGATCENPDNGAPVTLSAPFEGQAVTWFNFDVRAFAGGYDFQVISNDNIAWALFYVNPGSVTNSVGPDGLSGDCNDLAGFDGTGYVPYECGTNFTGWRSESFGTPLFDLTTNVYILVWRRGATNTSNDDFNFNFKLVNDESSEQVPRAVLNWVRSNERMLGVFGMLKEIDEEKKAISAKRTFHDSAISTKPSFDHP